MNWMRDLADRLGVDVWVIWLALGAVVVAAIILVRRFITATNAANTATNAGMAGQNDVLNGPYGSGIDGTTANPNPTSPDGGADQGTTPAPSASPPSTNPPSNPRRVATVILPSDMTWPQIAARYGGGSQNAAWLLSWNSQLHSQSWYTVARGTHINVPQG